MTETNRTPLRINILTIFPEMFSGVFSSSILDRAQKQGLLEITMTDIRPYSDSKHHNTDDYPFGGGAGMVMMAQPIIAAMKDASSRFPSARRIYLGPRGRRLDTRLARELSEEKELILLCGHYEGIDARALEEIGVEEVSIGDFVLTGGELPAMIIIDAVSRLIPGVLGNADSADTDSFMNGLLEYPQYSRPAVWHGKEVPPVLLSGNHALVEQWRFEQSLSITKERRPDLYDRFVRQNPEIMEARRKRIERQKRLEERRRRKEQQADS